MKEHKAQKNFQRIESKYLVDAKTMTALEKEFSQHLVPDDYPVSTISNLYFDNADYDLVEDSLARLHGREKVRMRTYDAKPKAESFAFLEIKKKILEVGHKYHFEAENLFDFSNQHVYRQEEIISALEYFLHENYISGIIFYNDQGLPYHFIIDSMTHQGRVCLDSLEKEA